MLENITKKYDVILADPPWFYRGTPGQMAYAGNHYPLMRDEELLRLPVASIANPKSALFLWATCPRLDFAVECLKAWGFFYRGVAFVWVKTRSDGTPIGARGVRTSFVKPTTELVLVGSTQKSGAPITLASQKVRQVVTATPTKHSAKPCEIRKRIEEMYPNASKIELFARERPAGWDVWGNQV